MPPGLDQSEESKVYRGQAVDFMLTPELSALGIAEDDIFFKPIADTGQFVRRIQRAGDSS